MYLIVFNTSTLIDFFEQFVGFEFGTRSTGWIHQSAIVGMSNLIRSAVKMGKSAVTAIQMATIQAAQYFGLRHVLGYNPLIPGPKQTLSCLSRSVKSLIDLPHEIAICGLDGIYSQKIKD